MKEFQDGQQEYCGKRFGGIDVSKETIASKRFEDCEFTACNFASAQLQRCKLVDVTFRDCNFSLLRLDGTRVSNAHFASCKLRGVDWTKADWPQISLPPQIQFEECILDDSSFFGISLEEIVIERCTARDVDFRDCNLSRSVLKGTDFSRSLFGKTNLVGADFTDATEYNIDVFDNEIRGARFSRQEAVRLLAALAIELVD